MDKTQVKFQGRLSKYTCCCVDIKLKRILSLYITSEEEYDRKELPELVDDITIKQNKMIETAIMDGS